MQLCYSLIKWNYCQYKTACLKMYCASLNLKLFNNHIRFKEFAQTKMHNTNFCCGFIQNKSNECLFYYKPFLD